MGKAPKHEEHEEHVGTLGVPLWVEEPGSFFRALGENLLSDWLLLERCHVSGASAGVSVMLRVFEISGEVIFWSFF